MFISSDININYSVYSVGCSYLESLSLSDYTEYNVKDLKNISPTKPTVSRKFDTELPLFFFVDQFVGKPKIYISDEIVLSHYINDINKIIKKKKSGDFLCFKHEEETDYMEILKDLNFCQIYGISSIEINSKLGVIFLDLDCESG